MEPAINQTQVGDKLSGLSERAFTRAEAREAIDGIKARLSEWQDIGHGIAADIKAAHERQAHKVLYDEPVTWAAMVYAEFDGMSRSRSYQLLNHATVMQSLMAVGVSTAVDIPEWKTRGHNPARVSARVTEAKAEGKSDAESVAIA